MNRRSVGDLRHRLVVERPVDHIDNNGDRLRSFEPAGELWAAIESLRFAGGFAADRQEQSLTHHVYTRWRPDIRAGMRLRTSDRLMLIRSVLNPDQQKIQMICLCEEIAA